jgi:hypothetical protein
MGTHHDQKMEKMQRETSHDRADLFNSGKP